MPGMLNNAVYLILILKLNNLTWVSIIEDFQVNSRSAILFMVQFFLIF